MDKKTIKAYKGFDNNLCCRGFQYEVGKEYEMDGDIEVCERGFHAIQEDNSPMTVLDYYPPCYNGGQSRFCEVEIGGFTKRDNDKIVGSKIKIKAEIGIPGLVKAHMEWVKRNLIDDDEHKSVNNKDRSSASNTGDQSSASNTGDQSSASNTGYRSSASNTGYRSSASNTGDRSSASNTGDRSSASNTGYQSSASNTGDQSSAEVSGKDSVAAVFGYDCKARGSKGCALFLMERGDWNGDTYPILNVKAVIVDGKEVKADTWYKLVNGELVEVE